MRNEPLPGNPHPMRTDYDQTGKHQQKTARGIEFHRRKLYGITAKSEARVAALKQKIEKSRRGKAFPKLIKEHKKDDTKKL